MYLALLKPLIRFWYMHSQDFRISVVVAQDDWKKRSNHD